MDARMDAKTLGTFGLILDFSGAVLLLIYATKTTGAVTEADQDHVASRWWLRLGWALLALGFLTQILGNTL
jgi:uncharacterized membrane protein YfcA